jgi:hypothetical protein
MAARAAEFPMEQEVSQVLETCLSFACTSTMIPDPSVRVELFSGERFPSLANTGNRIVTSRPMGGLIGIAHARK